MTAPIVLDLDSIEAAAKAALQEPVSTAFLVKTNGECAEWMRSFYNADAIPTIDRHCTWSWQEQERRHAPVILELVRRLRAAEALAASRIEQIPTNAKMVAVFSDFRPEHQAQAEEFAEAIKKRCTSGQWTLVAFFPLGADIKALSVDQMREAGWVRVPQWNQMSQQPPFPFTGDICLTNGRIVKGAHWCAGYWTASGRPSTFEMSQVTHWKHPAPEPIPPGGAA